jgi:hypothetical protein
VGEQTTSRVASAETIGTCTLRRSLAPRLARAEHVQAHTRDYCPSAIRLGLRHRRVRAGESQPGFLDRVVRLAQRAEHPVGDRPEMRAVRLEPLRQPLILVHGHILWSRYVISYDGRISTNVTARWTFS